jgi:hypothetical protein
VVCRIICIPFLYLFWRFWMEFMGSILGNLTFLGVDIVWHGLDGCISGWKIGTDG